MLQLLGMELSEAAEGQLKVFVVLAEIVIALNIDNRCMV